MIRCIIYTDSEKTQESVLAPGEHTAGRSRSADVHLIQPDISGKHLKLEVRQNGVAAENLSSHGTLLNGSPLLEKTEIKEGDRLALGKHIEIGFLFSGGDAAAPAPEEDSSEATTLVPRASLPAPAVPAPSPDRPEQGKTCPGETQTCPGETRTDPGEMKTCPGETRTDPGEMKTCPGETQTWPGETRTDPGAMKTCPGETRTDPGETGPSPEAAAPVSGESPAGQGDAFKTDVMHTRLASMEEMNLLRNADRKRSTGKTFKYVLGVLAAVGLLVALYMFKSPPKEVSLTWPVDARGNAAGAFADPGTGGHRAGGFSLAYPSLEGRTRVEAGKDKISIFTRCGKDGSVPLRIFFIRKQSPAFLNQERREVLSAMLAELQTENKRWSLSQISDVFFIGSENGLPCLSVEYRREAEGRSWYGEVLFFRTGSEAFIRLAEIPSSERARGQSFISNTPFLKFSQAYLQCHWEGDREYRYDGDPGVMMDEISRHLSKQAPFEWARTYLLLQRVLMESGRNRNAALERNALNQLRRLRAMQTIWYNGQKIQYNTAKLSGNRHKENAVMELCKTVFSSPDDLRYFTLRRNIWE